MRTLLASEFFPPRVGGTATWFYEVYRRYPVGEAFVLSHLEPSDMESDLLIDLPVHRVPMKMQDKGFLNVRSLAKYIGLTLLARKLAEKNRIQFVHCARCISEGVIGLFLSRLSGIPYAVYAHGEEIGTACSSRQLRLLMNAAFRSARWVIANSQNTRNILKAVGVPDSNTVVIHPGVDTHRFHPVSDQSEARSKLNFNGRKILLSVGRLQRRKGHDVVIESLPDIASAVSDVEYVIVGGGEEEERLQKLAEEKGVLRHVRFVGPVADSELPLYYQASDVFIMPNRQEANGDIEGFGIVFLEANACGKAVIGGISGGTGDAIDDGSTGLRVDGNNPAAVADAAISLLKDESRAHNMGRLGRERVEREFDWDVIARKIRALNSGETIKTINRRIGIDESSGL